MWNRKKLEEKLEKLKNLLNEDSNERNIIISDINKIEEMISIIDPSFIASQKRIPLPNHLESSIDYLKNKDYTFLLGLNYERNIKSSLFMNKNKISRDKYLELVLEFFRNYDIEHYEILKKMILENRINFCNSRDEIYNARGVDYYLCSIKESYVSIVFKNRLTGGSVLSHEIGHTYQEQNLNFDKYIRLFYSIFLEAYSKFLEYAFADYLKETEYEKIGREIEVSQFYEINSLIEYYLDSFLNLKNSKFERVAFFIDNKPILSYKTLRNFYSEMLAIYFINIYRKNRSSALNEMKKFSRDISILENKKLLERYSDEMLKEAYIRVLK